MLGYLAAHNHPVTAERQAALKDTVITINNTKFVFHEDISDFPCVFMLGSAHT